MEDIPSQLVPLTFEVVNTPYTPTDQETPAETPLMEPESPAVESDVPAVEYEWEHFSDPPPMRRQRIAVTTQSVLGLSIGGYNVLKAFYDRFLKNGTQAGTQIMSWVKFSQLDIRVNVHYKQLISWVVCLARPSVRNNFEELAATVRSMYAGSAKLFAHPPKGRDTNELSTSANVTESPVFRSVFWNADGTILGSLPDDGYFLVLSYETPFTLVYKSGPNFIEPVMHVDIVNQNNISTRWSDNVRTCHRREPHLRAICMAENGDLVTFKEFTANLLNLNA